MLDLSRELIPPPELVKDGSSSLASYIQLGADFKQLFQDYLPLRQDMKVLDMGSSIGRIARQFINILSEKGSYTGIDIMPKQIEWCRDNISARFANFRFIHADIFNTEYNPQGSIKASFYVFPFEDNELDLVVLTSVFTHMLRRDVDRYLAEIYRILKPGGHCFATFFLFQKDELAEIIKENIRPRLVFPVYKEDGFPVVICGDSEDLEEAVGYEKDYLLRMVLKNGLQPLKELPGTWKKGTPGGARYQDILIMKK